MIVSSVEALFSLAASKYQQAIAGNKKYEKKIVQSVKLDRPELWRFLLLAVQVFFCDFIFLVLKR